MDKGIRPFCNNLFLQQLPTRVNTREGNTAFRKDIIAKCIEEFGITLASAATHYNKAFIEARKLAATDSTVAALLEGLGRPEDKKGGRKPKVKSEAAADAGTEGEQTAEDGTQEEAAAEEAAPVQKYSVCKASDKTVVCSDLTLEEAQALIEKAARAKKAKLELVQPAAEQTEDAPL